MKTPLITIPKFFHELFGRQQRKSELIIVIVFCALATALSAYAFAPYYTQLLWYQNLVLWLLLLDIVGGVVANLTWGTDNHYNQHPKARWLFIAIHIQPILLALALGLLHGTTLLITLGCWGYTILSSAIINSLRNKPYHRVLGGSFMALGLMALLSFGESLPTMVRIIYALYMIKVIYSFAVRQEPHQAVTHDT